MSLHMIDNSDNLSKATYQSYYTTNEDSYRGRGIMNGVMPHRSFTADFWEETIPLILEYLKRNGLRPEHKILDLGAGSFRSGLALIPYLDDNNYYAIDINRPLLEDGYKYEIVANNLEGKFPLNNIKITHDYNGSDFNVKFDYAWSFSLWTHLDRTECAKCLKEVSEMLVPGGIYLTTCFIVDDEDYHSIQKRISDVCIPTHRDKDPYHHRLKDFVELGNKYGLEVEYLGIGSCCPRKHDVVKFTKLHISL